MQTSIDSISLAPGWSLGDTATQGIGNWLSATPAEVLARGWEDARPYGQGVGADAGPGSSSSGTQASLSEHFSDAVAQAGAVAEDLWWLPGSAGLVAMVEIARRKALADRKAAMAAEGLTPIDNAADPRAMTFASADGSKTVEYTLRDTMWSKGSANRLGSQYCRYIAAGSFWEGRGVPEDSAAVDIRRVAA